MSSLLLTLATELQQEIILQLDRAGEQETLRSWSCTCSFYRCLLAPYVFRSLILRNYEKSASSVLVLANNQYKNYVEELHYTAEGECTDVFKWRYWTGETRGGFDFKTVTGPREVFPDIVHLVLSQLHIFPRLKTLSIEFPVNLKHDNSNLSAYWDEFDGDETEDQIQWEEDNEGWRALMAKTFDALSRNDKHSIKTLEIRKLHPFEVSTFRSEAFHDFLGG